MSSTQNRFSTHLSSSKSKIPPLYPTIEPLPHFFPSSQDEINFSERHLKTLQKRLQNAPLEQRQKLRQASQFSYPHLKVSENPNEITQIRLLIQKHETFRPDTGIKQPNLKDQLALSLSYLMKALELLKGAEKQYAVIIFDVSKRVWNACRITARVGARKWVLDVWRETLSALERVSQQCGASRQMSEWTIQCAIQYVLALDDAQQFDLAQKEMARINDIISGKAAGSNAGKGAAATQKEPISQHLLDDVFRLQLHIARNGKKGGAAPKDANQKYLLSVQNAKSGMFDDADKMKKELMDTLAALQKEVLPNAPAASEQKPSSVALKNAPRDKMLIIAELGFTAAHHSWDDLAADAVKLAGVVDYLHTSILADYTRADLLVKDMDVVKREKLTTEMVQTRLKAIALVEKGILNSRNLDPQYAGDVMLQGCILMWNLCLPLLNPNLRKHIYKPLYQAATALEEMDAHNINELRTKMLFELANCNVADDILTKASMHVEKSLALDYVAQQDKVDLYGMLRPLDRYLAPMKQHLDLKVDIYKMPETKEDEAYLLIEQARESKDVNLRKNLLERAYACLETSSDNTQDVSAAPSTNAVSSVINDSTTSLMRTKEKFNLYAMCVKTAWTGNFKIVSVAREVSEKILAPETWSDVSWNIERDREVFIDRALIHLIVAESYIVSLQQEDLELHTICDDDDEEGESLIASAEEILLKHISAALDIGVECKQLWIVENCCVYLWNYHLVFFQDRQEFAQFHDVLQKAFNSLKLFCGVDESAGAKGKAKPKPKGKSAVEESSMPKETPDPVILARITFAYINALLQRFALEKRTPVEGSESSSVDYVNLMDNIYTFTAASNASNDSLKRALEAAEFTIGQLHVMAAKDIIYQRAKLQKLMTDKAPAVLASKDVNEIEKMLTYIEALRQPAADAEKLRLMNEAATTILHSTANIHPQIYCWMSYHALKCNQDKLAIQIADKCFNTLPEAAHDSKKGDAQLPQITVRMWRWYALTTLNEVHGILQFVDPKNQNQTTQLNLRKQALEKLVHAMRYAKFSQDMRVGALVGNLCVACVAELMGQAVVRRSIQTQLSSILSDALFVKPEDAPTASMLEKLYTFAFRCIRENADYDFGLRLIKTALKHLPPTHHKNVWQFDVEYRSKAGNADVKSSINRVSGYDVEMQANVFAMVGHFSSDFNLQREAFAKAINILADKPFVQVNYMIQYAVWMYMHDIPLQEVSDLLMNCADILNDADTPADELDEIGGGDNQSDAGSVVSSRSGRSRRSRVSQRTKRSTRSAKSTRKSTTNRGSRTSQATSIAGGDDENENTGPLSIAQLDSMCTVYILLSLTSENAEERLDYALTAHFYYMRILKTAFDFANNYNLRTAESKIRHNKDITEENVPSVAYYQLPNTLEDWYNYKVPEEIRTVWQKQTQEESLMSESRQGTRPSTSARQEQDMQDFLSRNIKYSLQAHNFPQLDQSLYFLNELFDFLLEEGYYAHCVPLLNVKRIMGDGLTFASEHTRLVNLQFAHVFEKLSMKAEKDEFRTAAGDFTIAPHILRLQQEEHQILYAERSGNNGNSKTRSSSHRFKETIMGKTELRHLWIASAKYLIDSFELSMAHHLLEQALKDSKAHDDQYSCNQCHLYLAQIYKLQGNAQQAIQSSSQARTSVTDLKFLLHCLHVSIDALYEQNEQRVADALIADSARAFEAVCAQFSGNGRADAQIQYAEFQYMIASILMAHDVHPEQSVRRLESALGKMGEFNSKSVKYVQISIHYARFLLENSFYRRNDASNEGRVMEPDLGVVEASLSKVIAVLEKTKLIAQAICTEMIPPGSHLSDRYICSQLLSETLILLGRALSLLFEVQYQIEVDRQRQEKQRLLDTVNFPKMRPVQDEFGRSTREIVENSEDDTDSQEDPHHEALVKFMIQTSSDSNNTAMSKTQLEKSMTLFTTAANLTSSLLLQSESHLYVGQCMRKLHTKMEAWRSGDAAEESAAGEMILVSIQNSLEQAFRVALETESWNLLARIALDLSEMTTDAKTASMYIAFAQSMFASTELLAQFKQFSRIDQMEHVFINLFETMKAQLRNPEQNAVYTKVMDRLKQQSIVFQTLSPTTLVVAGDTAGTSKTIVEALPKNWPSSAAEDVSFVNLTLLLPPPPPSVIASIKRMVYAGVTVNLEAPPLDPKKKAPPAKKPAKGKEEEPQEEENPAPTRFIAKRELDIDALEILVNDYNFWKRSLSSRNVDTMQAQEEFQQIVQRTEALLSPLMETLNETLAYFSAKPNSKLILTSDSILANLPLEALSFCRTFGAVSRDYSALMIGARMRTGATATNNANWNTLSYIIDPFHMDDELTEGFAQLRQELTDKKVQLYGILGSEFEARSERPQITHIQQLLSQTAAQGSKTEAPKKGGKVSEEVVAAQSKGVLLYAGPNLIDVVKSTTNLSSLRLVGLNTCLVLDKQDKDSEYVISQDVATVLSLRGVGSIVLNQFASLVNVAWPPRLESKADVDESDNGSVDDAPDNETKQAFQDIHHQLAAYVLRRMSTATNHNTVAQILTELRKKSNFHFAACNSIVVGIP